MEKIHRRNFTADHDFSFWSSSSSSSASIGKNSDDEKGGEDEVESSLKGPLDMMESLEEVLPTKKGLSRFYKGKSKSFTSLTESESLPVKELTKPENSYSRRKRNLLCHRICHRGGISKKQVKSVSPLAVKAISQREGDSSSSSSSSGGDDSLQTPTQDNKNLVTPRESKGSFGNCVPVVDSPQCLQTAASRNIIF